jgi:feruloyl esterase
MLVSLTMPNVQIRSAAEVPAGLFEPYVTVGTIVRELFHLGGGRNSLTVPEFCRIKVTARPVADSEINFEVWIPPPGKWNGKFQGVGNAAWWGGLMYPDMARAVRQGFATAATDTGHSGDDLRFGLGHPEKVIDYAYRAVHVMTETAKLLIRVQTGRFAEHSYFIGCSSGGHQGLSEAQRYPEDYDGIVAGSPNNDRVRLIFGYLWAWMAAHPNGELVLPATKLGIITRAAVESCDAVDGLKDGLIDDPRACRFDAAALLCKGADRADCLTAVQVEAVRKIHDGLKDPRTGKQVLAGWSVGSEDNGDQSWRTYIVDPREPVLVQVLQYFLFNDATWDWNSIGWDRDLAYADEKLGFLAAIAPDLTQFEHHGGKLLMSTGWSDPLIPPEDVIHFYEAIMNASGGPAQTLKFARLFMVPGMGHCGGGPGPSQFDALTALDEWVTKDHAPDQLIASHMTDGKVDRSRPLCPYPQVARFKGGGSIDDAANFSCVEKPAAAGIGASAIHSRRNEARPALGHHS